jgi:hypothetical protein
MARSSLLLLVSGCYVHVDKTTADPPELLTPNTTSQSPEIVEDVVYQESTPLSDVLFVVQNDPDYPYHGLLIDQFPLFFDSLLGSGIDWHVGVVSSGLDDPDTAGVLFDLDGQRWLDPETPNPISSLAWESEDLLSRPRDAVYEALAVQGTLANAGFLRPGATLTVVVVSDGEDASTLSETEFVDWLATLGGTYSCLGITSGTACESTAALTGGTLAESEIMGVALEEAGLLASSLDKTFPLSAQPVPATIEVSVEMPDGSVYNFEPGDWVYNEVRNSIEFVEFIPSGGAAVHIRYVLASF